MATRLTGMRRVLVAALCVSVLFASASCTRRSVTRPLASPGPSTTTPATSAPAAGAPSAAASEPGTGASPGRTPGATHTPPRREDCVASAEEATVRPNEEAGPVCLRVGAKLLITAAPSPTQPWLLLSTSDAAVLRCQSTAGPSGSVSGTCAALKAGSATVSTQTKSFNDGAVDRWRLAVVIVA